VAVETNGKLNPVQLQLGEDSQVSAVVGVPEWWPSAYRLGLVLAHDIGSDMNDPLLVALQEALVDLGCLTVRFNFPFAEQGKKRPDPAPVLEKAYRAAIGVLLREPQNAPSQIVFAGAGLGARVASQVIAGGAKADAMIALGFPLHPSGKPSQQKAETLFRIICPILFVQGTRDAYCRIDRLEQLLRRIGAPTELVSLVDTDHQLNPIRRSPRPVEEVHADAIEGVRAFIRERFSP
jgi:predicted alpha/beta-hydrolase family hydrolase